MPKFQLIGRRSRFALATLAAATLLIHPQVHAIELLTLGDGSFGDIALTPNDDESSSLLNLPFTINFFGTTYNQFYVNNNGNVTFQSALGSFTPEAFPVANVPMIAPWWGDVDTSIPGDGSEGGGEVPALAAAFAAAATPISAGNNVFVGALNANTAIVTWNQVGYFPAQTDKTNTFQLVLRNREDTGQGNFDIDFRYQQLQWTTGSASGGTGGLGGIPAQAGYDAGDSTHYLTLPGSRTPEVLNLVNTSNVGTDTPGLWTFAVRNGETPGGSPSNPLMPVTTESGFQFDFNVQANTRYFIDPDIAVGYNFILSGGGPGQSFATVMISTNAGDGNYSLFIWNGTSFVDSGTVLHVGEIYTFASGTTQFSIRGIEEAAGLDPTDGGAFVTGVTFSQAGNVQVLQVPIVVTTPVPEPETAALMLFGIGMMGAMARRRQRDPRTPAR